MTTPILVDLDYERIDYARLATELAKLMSKPPAEEYWSIKQIAEAMGYHPKTAYAVVRNVDFPAPYFFTKERRWKVAEVRAWMEKRRL